jgi:hypothetical protein
MCERTGESTAIGISGSGTFRFLFSVEQSSDQSSVQSLIYQYRIIFSFSVLEITLYRSVGRTAADVIGVRSSGTGGSARRGTRQPRSTHGQASAATRGTRLRSARGSLACSLESLLVRPPTDPAVIPSAPSSPAPLPPHPHPRQRLLLARHVVPQARSARLWLRRR